MKLAAFLIALAITLLAIFAVSRLKSVKNIKGTHMANGKYVPSGIRRIFIYIIIALFTMMISYSASLCVIRQICA